MKRKKILGIAAISAIMGLSGCNLLESQTCVHEWSAWEVIEEPTCIERGIRERYCLKCPKYQSRSIAVDTTYGHQWMDDTQADTKATCTTPGVTGSQYCFLCNQKKKGTPTELSGHKMEKVENPTDSKYKDATCEEDGLELRKCKNCDYTDERALTKLGHTAGRIEATGTKIKEVYCSNTGCGKLMAYELDVSDAVGYHDSRYKMDALSGENSQSVWDISADVKSGIIPAGSYNVQIEAAMGADGTDGIRKLYNMARKDLAISGDLEGNKTQGTADDVNEDPYRYFVKVDATNYYPTTKESYSDLGVGIGGASSVKFVEFLNGVNISKESTTLSLIHGNIANHCLHIKSIRLVAHTHDSESKPAENVISEPGNSTTGFVPYTLEKCTCGYRKVTINAKDGVASADLDSNVPSNDYVRLARDNDSITYKVALDESITGSIYMVGKQSSDNMDKTPFNITVKNKDKDITGEWNGKKASDFLTLTSGADYSEEGRVLLGEVTLKDNQNGNNEIVITRTDDYNIAMSKIVIEGRPTGHVHSFEHTTDDEPTCRKNKIEHYACAACGAHYDNEIPDTKKDHTYQDPKVSQTPTCENIGAGFIKCKDCGNWLSYNIEKGHNMANINTGYDDAQYELKECSTCHNAREAVWTLSKEMIKDFDGSDYSTISDNAIAGKTYDGIDVSLFKFNKAGRRVELKFRNPTSRPFYATLKMLVTAKASEVSKCQPYQQSIGESSTKDKLTINGQVNADNPDNLNKSLAEIDNRFRLVSSASDGNDALAAAVWLDYAYVNVPADVSTIVVEVPEATNYDLYIGGFRLYYEN